MPFLQNSRDYEAIAVSKSIALVQSLQDGARSQSIKCLLHSFYETEIILFC